MGDSAGREPARDPQDLERLLVARQRAGDVDGMVALYEADAVIDAGAGQVVRGQDAIRTFILWSERAACIDFFREASAPASACSTHSDDALAGAVSRPGWC